MPAMTQPERARVFRELHRGPRILVLPNAWDVASARVFEDAGFPAIATTSAGVTTVFGYPDGQYINPALMWDMVRRIAQAVAVPVTADVEAGYDDPVQTALALMEAGAIGMNLEDLESGHESTLTDLPKQVEEIRRIRSETNLVINARTDTFLASIGDPATRFDSAVQRLNAYREAGADCLFAPGVRDAETIGRLVQAVQGPLNILAVAGTPPVPELQRLGVARVTVGSGPMRATLGLTRRIAQELASAGTFSSMTEGAISYADVNAMLQRKPA